MVKITSNKRWFVAEVGGEKTTLLNIQSVKFFLSNTLNIEDVDTVDAIVMALNFMGSVKFYANDRLEKAS